MRLNSYYTQQESEIQFSRQQASDFAKDVAGDFNPLHDIDTKKFCVPGDLLFSVALEKFGLSPKMRFTFSGMVSDNVQLTLPSNNGATLQINDNHGRSYLNVEREGEVCREPALISGLTQRYVEFSGHTFPHILLPLMKQHRVMLNPTRPLVIYERMSIDLDQLNFTAPELEITHSLLEVTGKRGTARLQFCLKSNGRVVGRGEKQMALGGLRDYDESVITQVVEDYDERKQSYLRNTASQ